MSKEESQFVCVAVNGPIVQEDWIGIYLMLGKGDDMGGGRPTETPFV